MIPLIQWGLNNHEKSMEKIEATKLVNYNVSCLLA